MKHGVVRFPSFGVRVEIPENDRERQLGLSYRTQLAPNAGMLFDFGREGLWSMTMLNTNLNLDMIFLNQQGEVVHVIRDCTAHSPAVFTTPRPAWYVLEVNAFWAYDHGVQLGDRARIEVLP